MSQVEQILQEITNRLDVVEKKLEGVKGGNVSSSSSSPAVEIESNATTEAFDEYVRSKVAPFVETSSQIGGSVAEMGSAVNESFAEVRAFIIKAAQSKKPSQEQIAAVLKPLSEKLLVFKQFDTRGEFGNHAKSLSEGIGSLMYVNPLITTPASHVEAFRDAAVFWINKVRKDFKEKADGAAHIEWCKQMNQMFNGLYDFVKQHQKMGVDFNPRGGDMAQASAPAPAAAKAPAPAPAAKAVGGGSHNVFAELANKVDSSGKASGLNHVTKAMKSKNNTGPGVSADKKPKKAIKFGGNVTKTKTPVFQLNGAKWCIEHQKDGVHTIEADQIAIKHTVYVYGCENATIVIKGKCNAIILDTCKKTQLIFETVLASCEVVNCKSVKAQINQHAATFSIDKTDGIVVYVMKREVAKELKIVTAKSSEMNVSYPMVNEDEGFIEKPIPEQFVSTIGDDDTVSTEVSDLYGH